MSFASPQKIKIEYNNRDAQILPLQNQPDVQVQNFSNLSSLHMQSPPLLQPMPLLQPLDNESHDLDSVRSSLESKLVNRMPRKRLLDLNILRAFDFDPVLQQVIKNLMQQRIQKLSKFLLTRKVNEKLSNRCSIQSLIRKGILKESNDAKDENTDDRRDMFRRMSNHSLTEFLTQRPTIDELVRASVVQDAMTWTKLVSTGAKPMRRNCAQIVLNKDNTELYLLGGFGTGGTASLDLLKLDLVNKSWTRPLVGGIVPSPRYCHTCVNIKNQLIVFGGFSLDGKWLNDLHALDLDYPMNCQLEYVPTLTAYNQCKANSTNCDMLLWYPPETTGDPPPPRAAHAACVVGKKMYIFGGNHLKKNVKNDLYSLDTETMQWRQIITQGSAPSARSNHSLTTIDSKNFILFGGNNDNFQSFNDLYIFNTETCTWYQPKVHGTPPLARGLHCAICINNKQLLIFGGGYNQKSLNDLHMFDIETKRWCRPSDTGELPSPRAGAACCLNKSNNAMYIVCGGDIEKDVLYNDVYQLDTSYFTTDEKEISKLMYPAQTEFKNKKEQEQDRQREEKKDSCLNSKNIGQAQRPEKQGSPDLNVNVNYYTPLAQAGIISDDIAGTTQEIDLLMMTVENGIQNKINTFRQKQHEYAMLLRQIEAERNKLIADVNRDMTMVRFAVKECLDKLQQKFIAKTLRQHMDMANYRQQMQLQYQLLAQQQSASKADALAQTLQKNPAVNAQQVPVSHNSNTQMKHQTNYVHQQSQNDVHNINVFSNGGYSIAAVLPAMNVCAQPFVPNLKYLGAITEEPDNTVDELKVEVEVEAKTQGCEKVSVTEDTKDDSTKPRVEILKEVSKMIVVEEIKNENESSPSVVKKENSASVTADGTDATVNANRVNAVGNGFVAPFGIGIGIGNANNQNSRFNDNPMVTVTPIKSVDVDENRRFKHHELPSSNPKYGAQQLQASYAQMLRQNQSQVLTHNNQYRYDTPPMVSPPLMLVPRISPQPPLPNQQMPMIPTIGMTTNMNAHNNANNNNNNTRNKGKGKCNSKKKRRKKRKKNNNNTNGRRNNQDARQYSKHTNSPGPQNNSQVTEL